jgi:hypothetical protein
MKDPLSMKFRENVTRANEILKRIGRDKLVRGGLGISISTLIFVFCFIGLIGLVNGDIRGSGERLGFYIFIGSVVFIATIYKLEKKKNKASEVMNVVIAITVLSFIIVSLSGEGMGRVIQGSGYEMKEYLYLVAEGLACTGIGYWIIKNWRYFK